MSLSDWPAARVHAVAFVWAAASESWRCHARGPDPEVVQAEYYRWERDTWPRDSGVVVFAEVLASMTEAEMAETLAAMPRPVAEVGDAAVLLGWSDSEGCWVEIALSERRERVEFMRDRLARFFSIPLLLVRVPNLSDRQIDAACKGLEPPAEASFVRPAACE